MCLKTTNTLKQERNSDRVYVEDPDAKDTLIAKFYNKDFEKRTETYINDHFTHIDTICDYIINLLPSTNRRKLTKDERGNALF